ncbi:unnamed protein product [marine sediment metagenome]|uniref:Uncharacterized protein n=1 Tax=marine sediment metagenome TaxID=412755 RepID=X1TDK5_9ZZZZ
MKLERAQEIADELLKRLYPYCQRIEVAGSVKPLYPHFEPRLWSSHL